MYSKQADQIREWLKAYTQNEKEIDELLEKLRYIRAKATSIGCQEISDMPRAPLKIKDTLAEYMIRCDELERKIKDKIETHQSSKAALEGVIQRMESPKQQRIITYRYIYGMEWSDVIYECYKDKPDYQVKIKAYSKRVYRDHDRALEEMSRKWTSRRDEKTDP